MCFILVMLAISAMGQQVRTVGNVRTIKLYKYGEQQSYPVMQLGGTDALELHFDDLDADIKNYYYTFELFNADWTRTMLRPFEYIRGFEQVRITNYRRSSISLTNYTHYQATLPDRNCIPMKSGNYLLKVFLNSDTSQLVFTRRFLVVDVKSTVGGQVQQPFNSTIFQTHQKLQVGINTDPRIKLMSPQDLRVVVLQNFSWANAVYLTRPTTYRNNYYEYNDEAYTSFQAGKEWRWLDLRSFRLLSDRIDRFEKKQNSTEVIVKPDAERQRQIYLFYRDFNGLFTIETAENINPFWQADYANVRFSFFPPGNREYSGRNVYIYGELTGYAADENSKMTFNSERGAYEVNLFLKQGFYNYSYITTSEDGKENFFFDNTEGNYWGTENSYMILVYHRPFGARADELIGFSSLNSVFPRN